MFNAPSVAGVAAPPSNYIQPTLNHGLRIWWAYYWPTNLIAGVIIFCLRFWLFKLYDNLVLSARAVVIAMGILPYATTYVVAFFIIWYVLGKRFRHFRIALLPAAGGADTQPVRRTFQRTLRVWWTFSWRSLLYFLIAWIVVILPLTWFAMLFRPGPLFVSLFFAFVGFLVNGAISLFVIYSNVLDEDFGDFSVVLLPRNYEQQTLPASTPTVQGQTAI